MDEPCGFAGTLRRIRGLERVVRAMGIPGGEGRQRRATVALAFLVLWVCTGVHYAFGVLFKPLLAAFGGGRGGLSLAATISLVTYGLAQPAVGALTDRFGPRRVLATSMVAMGAITILLGAVGTLWQFTLLYGIAASLAYTGTSILPVSVLVLRWFVARQGMALGLTATGFSLGHLVFSQIATWLVLAVGWRLTYVWLGLAVLAAAAPVALWVRDGPEGFRAPGGAPGPAPAATSPAPGPSPPLADRWVRRSWADRPGPFLRRARAAASAPGREALREAGFWLIASAYIGCGFTDFLIATHLVPLATDLGLSPQVGANGVSVLAAANIVGILMAGRLADQVGPQPSLALVYGVRAASLVMLLFVGSAPGLYLFAAVFGGTFFTTSPLTSALLGARYGVAPLGRLFGLACMLHHLAGGLGSYLGGVVFDLAGSYRPALVVSIAAVAWAATATAAVPRRQEAMAPTGSP